MVAFYILGFCAVGAVRVESITSITVVAGGYSWVGFARKMDLS